MARGKRCYHVMAHAYTERTSVHATRREALKAARHLVGMYAGEKGSEQYSWNRAWVTRACVGVNSQKSRAEFICHQRDRKIRCRSARWKDGPYYAEYHKGIAKSRRKKRAIRRRG